MPSPRRHFGKNVELAMEFIRIRWGISKKPPFKISGKDSHSLHDLYASCQSLTLVAQQSEQLLCVSSLHVISVARFHIRRIASWTYWPTAVCRITL